MDESDQATNEGRTIAPTGPDHDHGSRRIVLAREGRIRLGALGIEPALRRVAHDDGREEIVEPRVMQVLVALILAGGRILTRDDLLMSCWHGVVVGEDAIDRVIGRLRRLADGIGGGAFKLETITKVGYRLVSTDPRAQIAPSAPPPNARHNLPRRQASLIGRGTELAQLAALIASSDLVTVTGTGGVGKTRIAIEVGLAQLAEHEDGVWLVELAPVSDPGMAPSAVARAMNIDIEPGQDPLTSLVDRLRARHCLILLDNCEHLIDAAAGLVEAILERAPHVKVLASSQELLGVQGEQVFRLRSLGEPDAAALFAERARAADIGFEVGPKNAEAVAAICHRLDGIPLAIEMAAGRAPALGCEGLLQHLDDRFRLLTGGRRTALPRQRTLLATLDWSHGLLSERDGAVFRRLGVFTAGCTLEAASEVAADERIDELEVIEALYSLVAKSLVAADTWDDGTRYRLLETTRAYALEKLAAAGETLAVQRRHAQYMLKFVTPVRADYYGAVSDDAFAARYFADIDNIDRAIDWAFGPGGDAELGVAITAASARIFIVRSRYREYIQCLAVAEASLTPATPEAVRCAFLVSRATAFLMNNEGMPTGVADEAVEAARASGDAVALGEALNAKGYTALFTGRVEEARALANESLAVVAALPLSRLTGQSHHFAAYVTLVESGDEAARPLFGQVVAELRSIGAEGLANWFLLVGSSSSIPRDNPHVAIIGLRDAMARIRPWHMFAGNSTGLAASHLAFCLATRGEPADIQEARTVGRTYRKVASRVAGGGTVYLYYLAMAWLAAAAGRLQTAARLGGYVEALRAAQGNTLARAREEIDRLRTSLGGQLPEAGMGALWAEGARISQDEADRLAAEEG